MEKLIINFDEVLRRINLINKGQKPYYYQYLLNPTLSLDDVYFVLKAFVVLVLLRYVILGTFKPGYTKSSALLPRTLKNVARPKCLYKCCENLWYTLWHTASFVVGAYVLKQAALTPEAPGWTRLLFRNIDVKWYWFPTPAEVELGNLGWPMFPISQLEKAYYLIELAYWMSCALYLFVETRRRDFNAFLLHHTATCCLMLISYCLSFWRVGTLVLVLHDTADIFLYTAKTFYYSKSFNSLVNYLFMCFAIVFFLSRLVAFPLFCLRHILSLHKIEQWTNGAIKSHWQVPGGVVLPCFLCVLQLIHIFWFFLILKMVVASMSGAKICDAGDIRSDDEGYSKRKAHNSDSDECSIDSDDRSIHIDSLPGVCATTTAEEKKKE